jgi:hypothetical protein
MEPQGGETAISYNLPAHKEKEAIRINFCE